ncbi:MAG TPA: MGMT family protein [Bryobacteraceae bacterium]|nr:MGMT family protein [Bryobacteraceae bacterium]
MKLEEFRDVVRRIPRGSVMTYGEVATAAGHRGSARQVVWALHNCGPDLPWHRVVGAGGRILLPGEAALEQRLRLEAEGVAFVGGRVKLEKKLQTKLKSTRAPRR